MTDHQPRILVVDDLFEWRESLSGLLGDQGYETHVAGTTNDAHQLLAQFKFNLALLDIRLDDSDEDNQEGLTLGEYIRAYYPATAVIILTGFGRIEYAQRVMEPTNSSPHAAAYDFVIKSEPRRLLASVKEVLSRQR